MDLRIKCQCHNKDTGICITCVTPICTSCCPLCILVGDRHKTEPFMHLNTNGAPLVAAIYSEPHICTLDRLKAVQYLYRHGRISSQIFDSWLTLNSGGYQLGGSQVCTDLWKIPPTLASREGGRLAIADFPIAPRSITYIKCPRHKHITIRINWGAVKSRADLKVLNQIWLWSSAADKNKTVIDACSLAYHIKLRKLTKELDAMLPFISTKYFNVTAVALMLHAIGNPYVAEMIAYYRKFRLCCLDESSYAAVHKAISVALRRTSRWFDGTEVRVHQIAMCAGWELSIGRSGNVSDWREEEEKRTKKYAWLKPGELARPADRETNTLYLDRLQQELEDIFSELRMHAQQWTSWETFVEERQDWVSSGSAAGHKIMVDGVPQRVNKHAYFENIPDSEILGWLDSEPAIHAVASEKYEPGKSRAIYGTKPIDYAIMTYVIRGSEQKLNNIEGVEAGLRGLDEVAGVCRRSLISDIPGIECTMLDYADFNYQHTLDAQALVFRVMRNQMIRIGACDDAVKAAKWCEDALLNQWTTFPRSGGEVKVSQGMFSGVRGTNFMNTILNVAYYREARRSVARLFDLKPECEFTLHQGDDVWISNKSRLWAAVLYTYMQATGFEFQGSKQVFDVGRGEFLRVLYAKGEARGYLARALATLIVKPIQSTDDITIMERATTINGHIHLLYRRGLSLIACECLWYATVPHALQMKRPGGGISIPVGIAMKATLDGGLDLGPPCTLPKRSARTAAIPSIDINSPDLVRACKTYMSDAWVRVISRKYCGTMNARSVAANLHESNVLDSVLPGDRLRALDRLESDLRRWLSKIQDKTGQRDVSLFNEFVAAARRHPIIDQQLSALRGCLDRKSGFNVMTQMGSLRGAIAMSPFRDISTARRALGLGTIESAAICINLCPSEEKALAAGAVLAGITQLCSAPLAAHILEGTTSIGPSFESLLNPIILSWCVNVGTDIALNKVFSTGNMSIDAWDESLRIEQLSAIAGVISDALLLELSHY